MKAPEIAARPPGLAKPVTTLIEDDLAIRSAIRDAISCCGRPKSTVAVTDAYPPSSDKSMLFPALSSS